MAVKLVFLGKLAELAGADERPVAAPLDWAGLLAQCDSALGEAVADSRVKVALNGVLVGDKSTLIAADGDEVALLPPVSGG